MAAACAELFSSLAPSPIAGAPAVAARPRPAVHPLAARARVSPAADFAADPPVVVRALRGAPGPGRPCAPSTPVGLPSELWHPPPPLQPRLRAIPAPAPPPGCVGVPGPHWGAPSSPARAPPTFPAAWPRVALPTRRADQRSLVPGGARLLPSPPRRPAFPLPHVPSCRSGAPRPRSAPPSLRLAAPVLLVPSVGGSRRRTVPLFVGFAVPCGFPASARRPVRAATGAALPAADVAADSAAASSAARVVCGAPAAAPASPRTPPTHTGSSPSAAGCRRLPAPAPLTETTSSLAAFSPVAGPRPMPLSPPLSPRGPAGCLAPLAATPRRGAHATPPCRSSRVASAALAAARAALDARGAAAAPANVPAPTVW